MSIEGGAGTTAAATTQASSTVHQNELLLYFVLLQLVVIVIAARIGGRSAVRIGQTAAVGEIIVGLLLGPSLFGAIAPDTFHYVFQSVSSTPLTILSQLGLILLMFQIGLEFDFGHLGERDNRKAVWSVAIAGMVAPFALGYGFGYVAAPVLSPRADPVASALFVATAFSITALPILGRILIDFNLTRTALGVIAISAAAINDVVGWLLLAMVTAITVAQFSPGAFALKIVLVLGFFAASWFIVRPLLLRVIRRMSLPHDRLPHGLIGLLLAVVFLGGMATYQLGIFAIFGGFMMGVILHDERELVAAWNEKVGGFVLVFFLPIFFTYTGLRTNVGGLATASAWGWCLLLIALATLGKFGGCYLAARFAGLPPAESKLLGIMMNTRALMELIVLNVGYDLGVISPEMFTMLVLMAIVSTVITSPALRAWLPETGVKTKYATLGADLPAKPH